MAGGRQRKSIASQLKAIQSPVAAAKAQDRARRKQEQYKGLLTRLRVRKSDKGRIILLSVKGKRIDKRNLGRLKSTKVFAVRVTRTGKKSFVREKRGQREFHPKLITSWKILRTGRRDEKEFYVNLRPTKTRAERIVPTASEIAAGTGVLFERFVKALTRDIKSRKGRGNLQLIVKVIVKLRGIKAREFVAEFKARYNQAITGDMVAGMAWGTFWPQIADWLDEQGLVATGSAAYVESLSVNRGKNRKQWQVKFDGKWTDWGKGSLPERKFDWIQWDILRIAVGNEGKTTRKRKAKK